MEADNAATWRPVAVDRVFEGFRSSPGLAEPVESRPWGTREFVLEAPHGHRFRIGHGE
jgi:hypothetical protein